MEGSEAGFTGFIGFTGLGSLNCDLCDLVIIRIERGRESEFPPTRIFCFRYFVIIYGLFVRIRV